MGRKKRKGEARFLLPAFLCAQIFIERETSFYEAVQNILVIFFLLFILISYRNPKHAEWAHSYIAALIELQQYCKEFHPIGVSWAAEW